ncbi:endonuclease domain-containing protein [Flaviaesturariibacter aridisoli]|uniref:Endonuclease domain-containing protein n=1 Tax=Flaviaesturariibacter aridisoli TaxID=2545761 RepID=A0A4R4DYU9_9BACT|nr:endonuclease domain-containing protein [Flaviaesturariibacter aridisoli]TCZ71022.1 endonuclease domain-containing protein [Flaviaesturariibacter aridisoli]
MYYYNPNRFEYYRAEPKTYRRLQEFAKANRQNPTPAEKQLWNALKGKRLAGFKFRRQYIISTSIVDFACLQHLLIVEVDGSIHLERDHMETDAERTKRLEAMGFQVIRFSNEQVLEQLNWVEEQLLEA